MKTTVKENQRPVVTEDMSVLDFLKYLEKDIRIDYEDSDVERFLTELPNIDFETKRKFIKNDIALWLFIKDTDPDIRGEVAKRDYCIRDLSNDSSWVVRLEVAKLGYYLDKLALDPNENVRAEVIRHGYIREDVEYDTSSYVKILLAGLNLHLDTLIKDKDARVRAAVVSQGYGRPDDFLDDPDEKVVAAALGRIGNMTSEDGRLALRYLLDVHPDVLDRVCRV